MSAESNPQAFTNVSADPFVRGFLHRPAIPNGGGLVLTHGAGSNCQAPLLIAFAKAFAEGGFVVLRCDLPYRQDLSYPLHPPRKPEQLRTQHFFDLRTPPLFVHGVSDPFGSIAELEQALKIIPAKTRLLTIEGAGHDLGFKGKAKREELPAHVSREFQAFFRD